MTCQPGTCKPVKPVNLCFTLAGPKQKVQVTHQRCFGITGQALQIEGTMQATLSFPGNGSFSYSGNFLISNHLFQPLQCVLGWDFLTSNGLNLLCKGPGAYFLVGSHGDTPLTPDLPDMAPLPPCQTLGCAADESDGRTEVLVYAKVPQSCKDELGIVMPVQSIQISQCVLSAYSVSQAEGRCIPIRLMNTANFDIELQAGQKVSEFCPVVESSAVQSDSLPYSVNANFAVTVGETKKVCTKSHRSGSCGCEAPSHDKWIPCGQTNTL